MTQSTYDLVPIGYAISSSDSRLTAATRKVFYRVYSPRSDVKYFIAIRLLLFKGG